jgi:hypothetical protein
MTDETIQTPPARPPFKVSGAATIKHLNVRKEGPEDEKILAVDVKLEIKNVDRRLCAYFDDALEAFLWRGDSDALIARNMYLAPVTYGNEISSATVRIANQSFVGCDVKKFAVEPRDGGVVTLACSVSIYPTSSDISELAKIVQDDAHVTIEGPPDLFADQPAPAKGGTTVMQFDGGQAGGEPDDLYAKAVEVVRTNKKASISLVQRHLQIGYNRAASLLETMEKRGVVSPMDSKGARKILSAEVAA